MKFIPLVLVGIRRKRSRSILILLQVIIAFTLYGVLQGLTSGINHAIAATHPDRLYVGSKLNLGDPLPVSILEWLKTVPGVVGVAPRYQFGASYQRPDQGVPICATDVDAFLALYPEDRVDSAQQRAMRQVQDGVIVGIGTMHKYGWKVGQRVTLQSSPQLKRVDGTNNWTFDIVGTWVDSEDASEDNSQLLITHYRYVNESFPTGPGRDTMNLAVLRIADPARATPIEQAIDSQYANSSNETLTQSEHELVQSEVANFGDIDTVAHRVVAAAFLVLLFATGALMMQSIRERTPELAVLKTVGFSDRRVMGLILAETLVLCLAGAAIGLWLGMRLLPVAREQIGTVSVPPIVFAVGFACAVVLANALQRRAADGGFSWPSGIYNYWKSAFLADLSDQAIGVIRDFFARVPSKRTVVVLESLANCAIQNVPDDATAFVNRRFPFNFLVTSAWSDPAESERNVAWTRQFFDAMRPFSAGAAYVNYIGDEGADGLRVVYGANSLARLERLKVKYDPTNTFRLNQNVARASSE